MKRIVTFLAPLLLSTMALQAQLLPDGSCFGEDKRPSASFQWNKQFEHAMALPERLVEILQADDSNQKSFRECRARGDLTIIPPEWFTATRVKITEGEPPAILVRGDHSCLRNQDTAPFWLFRETQTDYTLVLSVRTQTLQVLQDSHNGYRNLCAKQGDYGTYWFTIYQYEGDKYGVLVNGTRIVD